MKPKKILISICALATLLVVAFFHNNSILSVVFLAIIAIFMVLLDGNKKIFFLFLIVGIAGALSESFAIHSGAWTYANISFLGIPAYLPFLWGNAGLFIKSISEKYNKNL